MDEQYTNPITPSIKGLFESLKDNANRTEFPITGEEVIKINNLTSTAGTFYEKVRYLLDYKDEHTIKRSAIARILKREILIEGSANVGLSLLQELITGGYLPNNRIPERVSVEVQEIAARYLSLMRGTRTVPKSGEEILEFAANEISRLLFPVHLDEAVLDVYYESVKQRVKAQYNLPAETLELYLYIACRRGLLREDNDSTAYALWLRFSHWHAGIQAEDIQLLSQHFATIQTRITSALKDPLGWELLPKLKNESIYFSVLKEIVEKYGVQAQSVIQDRGTLEQYVAPLLAERYGKENAKTTRSAFRAVLYIFCTKIVLAVLLELPYELYVLGSIHYLPLASNIFIHPILLFLITRVQPLDEQNTRLIVKGVYQIVRGEGRHIMLKKSSWGALSVLFSFLYFFMFTISFGVLIFGLVGLGFNIASIILFMFFLTLVSYFGIRIRHNAQRWKVRTDDERLLPLLWNVFTLPIVRAGRWLSKTFSAINIFVFLMDFIVESPFKTLLRISDAFTSFLREKREETF